MALDVDLSRTPPLAVRPQARRIRVRRCGGTGQAGAHPMPGAPGDPANRLARMSPAGPGAQRDPGEMIEPLIHGVTHTRAGVIGPSLDCRVQLADS
jgi:hypothetical protein